MNFNHPMFKDDMTDSKLREGIELLNSSSIDEFFSEHFIKQFKARMLVDDKKYQ
jgi:hypothetical protein